MLGGWCGGCRLQGPADRESQAGRLTRLARLLLEETHRNHPPAAGIGRDVCPPAVDHSKHKASSRYIEASDEHLIPPSAASRATHQANRELLIARVAPIARLARHW